MKRYRLMYRGCRDTYYAVDTQTGKRESLGTNVKADAERLLESKNEAVHHVAINLQIAQVYLKHSDPSLSTRTWKDVMASLAAKQNGSTRNRYEVAAKDPALNDLRSRKLLETQSHQFLSALQAGTVATNVFLRRFHNYAVGMQWLPWPILPQRLWPQVRYQEKRGITLDEHQRILAREKNAERKAFLQVLWGIGAAQTDAANLTAEAIDWTHHTIAFNRCKTGAAVVITFGPDTAAVLRTLPATGLLFPMLARQNATFRGNFFANHAKALGIAGVSLHSYRYAWAERAKCVGMPERYAQQALGHASKALARAYSKRAKFTVPSLEAYESKIVEMPLAVNQ